MVYVWYYGLSEAQGKDQAPRWSSRFLGPRSDMACLALARQVLGLAALDVELGEVLELALRAAREEAHAAGHLRERREAKGSGENAGEGRARVRRNRARVRVRV